jgi:hypothetical protein
VPMGGGMDGGMGGAGGADANALCAGANAELLAELQVRACQWFR